MERTNFLKKALKPGQDEPGQYSAQKVALASHKLTSKHGTFAF